MNQFELTIARRYLWAQRKNLSSGLIALFSAAGVAIGTWLLIFVLSASNGFEEEVKNQLMGKDAHFELNLYHYDPMENYDSLLQFISGYPSVTAASPYIMSQAVFAKKKKFSGGIVFGIHPELSGDVIGLKDCIKWGAYQFDSLPDAKGKLRDGVIMGYALASRLGLMVGDKCVLYVFGEGTAITPGIAPKVKVFVLAGTFESGMYQFDESLSYISLKAAQETFNMDGSVTGIHARVKDPLTSGEIAKDIEQELGYPYYAIDWQEKNRTLIKWMDNDKRREIGILRAMGATRKNIQAIFMLEGLLIGIIGSTVGLVLGLLSCYLQKTFGFFRLPGDVYFVTVLPVVTYATDVVAVLIVTNLLCILATIVPAFRAARQNPVDAIRYE
jgi:lipoprotein-releasing system permease protein